MLSHFRTHRWVGWAVVIVLVIAFCPVAVYRVTHKAGGTDFPGFYAAGHHVLEHQVRHPDTLLHRFLPSVDVVWAAVAVLPMPAATVLWYVLNCLAWVGLLRVIQRHLLSGEGEDDRRGALLATALLTIVPVLDHLALGAFHLVMLWLMVAGLTLVMKGRDWSGALLLGLSIWLKILPLLGVAYLLLKRKWRAAAASVLLAAGLDAALSAMAYGPLPGWQTHVTWWQRRAVGDLEVLLTAPGVIEHQRDRNQSLAAVMRRTLTRMGWDSPKRGVVGVSMCDLSPAQLRLVFGLTTGTLFAALGYYWRWPAAALGPRRWAGEVSLVALATMWFCPVVWGYHPTAAMPALAIVLTAGPRHLRLKQVVVVVWLAALVLLGIPLARALGEYLWASLVLGGAVMWVTREREGGSVGTTLRAPAPVVDT